MVYQKCGVAFKIETKPTHSEQSMIRIGHYVKQAMDAAVSFPLLIYVSANKDLEAYENFIINVIDL